MTQDIKLKAEERKNKEGKLEKTNYKDYVPANVYGENFENKNIKIKIQDIEKAYEKAGESNLIELQINSEEPMRVLIKEVQENPVKGNIIHVDFYKVDMTKTITTEIPLEFVGESEAVKNLGGILTKNYDSVEVECLPGDLIDHIEVDISSLKTFDDSLTLADIQMPEKMKLLDDPNNLLASVAEPRVEEEPEPESEEGAEAAKEEGAEEAGAENKGEQEEQSKE